MFEQIRAIAWAQFRTTRNHLPRTNVGSILLGLLSLLWYGLYVALARPSHQVPRHRGFGALF